MHSSSWFCSVDFSNTYNIIQLAVLTLFQPVWPFWLHLCNTVQVDVLSNGCWSLRAVVPVVGCKLLTFSPTSMKHHQNPWLKLWEESIVIHNCFSQSLYSIYNSNCCSTLNLTTLNEICFHLSLMACMHVDHFIPSNCTVSTPINSDRHKIAWGQVLWYIQSRNISDSTCEFLACIMLCMAVLCVSES